MKKLLKKKYFIPLLVVAVMAISATVAYAWWTTTVNSGPNTISTGDESLLLGGSLPMTAAGLVPQNQLDNDPNSSVAGYQTGFFYVQNTGTNPVDFVGWLGDGTGDYGVSDRRSGVKITIAPTLAQGSPWDRTGSLSYNQSMARTSSTRARSATFTVRRMEANTSQRSTRTRLWPPASMPSTGS